MPTSLVGHLVGGGLAESLLLVTGMMVHWNDGALECRDGCLMLSRLAGQSSQAGLHLHSDHHQPGGLGLSRGLFRLVFHNDVV